MSARPPQARDGSSNRARDIIRFGLRPPGAGLECLGTSARCSIHGGVLDLRIRQSEKSPQRKKP